MSCPMFLRPTFWSCLRELPLATSRRGAGLIIPIPKIHFGARSTPLGSRLDCFSPGNSRRFSNSESALRMLPSTALVPTRTYGGATSTFRRFGRRSGGLLRGMWPSTARRLLRYFWGVRLAGSITADKLRRLGRAGSGRFLLHRAGRGDSGILHSGSFWQTHFNCWAPEVWKKRGVISC